MRCFTQHWCSFTSHRYISSSHFPILIFIRTQEQTKFYAHFSFLLISFQRQLICDYLYLDITMSVSCIWSNEYINHINWLKPIQRQPWLKYLNIEYCLNFRIKQCSPENNDDKKNCYKFCFIGLLYCKISFSQEINIKFALRKISGYSVEVTQDI